MNPKEVLGLPEGPFDLATLRRAYAEKLREHRPHADPEGFRRVRNAYELLSTCLRHAAANPGDELGTRGHPGDSRLVTVQARTRSPGGEVPPTSAPESDPGWTADAVLAAWLRGEASSALEGIEALARAGDVEQVERLALQTLEDPRLPATGDAAHLAIAVARVAALVRPDLALRLADVAWRGSTPEARRRLNTHSVDLRRLAAQDLRLWSPSDRRIVLRVAAGVPPPPVPMSADWNRALARIGRLPPESPLLAWLAVEAPEALSASGALYFAGRAPRPPRRRRILRGNLAFIALLWVLASVVTHLAMQRPAPVPPSSNSFLKQHPELFDRLRQVDDGTDATELDQLVSALRALDTTPPPDPERARAALDEIDSRFSRLISTSVAALTLYTEARRKHLPVDETPDDPSRGSSESLPR